MSGEVIVDALPYYDTGYDETGVRDAAMSLVDEEMKRYRPTKNYLDIIPPANYTSYETKLMRIEFERIQGRLPQEPLIMKRYELPGPSSGRMNDINAWKDCLNNSRSQLEHQVIRIENLQLLNKFGVEAWKMYTEELTKIYQVAQKRDMEIRKDIQNINWNRKNEQTAAGAQLKDLENSWVNLVTKNYEIEQACVDLEQKQATARAMAALQGQVPLSARQLEEQQLLERQEATRKAHEEDARRGSGGGGGGEGVVVEMVNANGGDVVMEGTGQRSNAEGERDAEMRDDSQDTDDDTTDDDDTTEEEGDDSPPEKRIRKSSEDE